MSNIIFRQLFDEATSTLTYIFGDAQTKEIAIVDSVREHVEHYVHLIQSEGWKLKYLLETHIHADHVTGNAKLLEQFPEATICLYEKAPVRCKFTALVDGSELKLGNSTLRAIHTPGHTQDDMCFLLNNERLFTGDTLFINSCGRTDFQAGSAESMHDSLKKITALAQEVLIYPGHDYNKRRVSSLHEQLLNNPLLSLSKSDFVTELNSWQLPPPKHIKEALPANLTCGKEK